MVLLTREIIDNGQIVYLDGMDTNEAITENEDNSYTIFINRNLSDAKRLKAIQYALKHIKEKDFEKSDVQEIESKRHAV